MNPITPFFLSLWMFFLSLLTPSLSQILTIANEIKVDDVYATHDDHNKKIYIGTLFCLLN